MDGIKGMVAGEARRNQGGSGSITRSAGGVKREKGLGKILQISLPIIRNLEEVSYNIVLGWKVAGFLQ